MPIITDAMKTERIADALVSREHEVADYQMNIDNYTIMLAALPQDAWPDELAKYKSIEPSKINADVDLETVMIISDYQYRDRLRILLRTENVEKAKTQYVLDALDGQLLDAGTRDADITAAVGRRDAALAKATA